MQAGLRAVLGAAGKGCGQNPALPVFLFTGLISLLKTKTKKTSGIKADTHTYSERERGGSCTPHWPLNNYVTEHDLKLLTLRPLSSKCWAFSGVHPYTWFMWCIDQTYSSYMLVKLFTSWATSLVPCLKDFNTLHHPSVVKEGDPYYTHDSCSHCFCDSKHFSVKHFLQLIMVFHTW